MRETEVFLLELEKLWSEDDATCVASPVVDVECRVVIGKGGVSGIAEDSLDEIEGAYEATWGEEVHLHAAARHDTRDLGDDYWAYEE